MATSAKLTPSQTRKVKQAIAKAQEFTGLELSMGPLDTQFNMVEPMIDALGWNTSDPTEVHRGASENISMLIQADGKSAIAVSTLKQGGSIGRSKTKAASLKDAGSKGADWTVITNGTEYWLYSTNQADEPFAKLDVSNEDFSTQAYLLSKSAFTSGALLQAYEANTTDDVVQEAIDQVLTSEDFTKLIRKHLRSQKVKVSTESVQSSLARLISSKPQSAKKEEATPAKASKATEQASAEAAEPKKRGPGRPKKNAANGEKAKPAASTRTIKEIDWIEGATHKMARKKNQAFIKYDPKSQESILLPGSIITSATGKSLTARLVQHREDALEQGLLRKRSGMFEVVEPITFPNPKVAATFAASALVKDNTCWADKNGDPMDAASPKASEPTSERKSGTLKLNLGSEESKAEDIQSAEA